MAKCITNMVAINAKPTIVIRVADHEAEELVEITGKWRYCPKHLWKQYGRKR